ncbi:MAG TPA: A/G-specific adenine glycosylase [Longimicrobiales bacterium]|nr:A/G-specific adenine glycosylase [Longimicrobiales bacterium]
MTSGGRLRARLLAWFDAHARDLPWRRSPTPYETLVSEVMLQQTRVDTVIPYYERWLARFPDLRALADADEDDVLRAWEGLGYYSRARNLRGAALAVCERFAGELPDDYASLRELPGVGDYTAGAVASMAFGRVEPAVDGNVKRVLARLFDMEAPRPAELRARAAALVDPDRPGDSNQALMELGATICTPRAPECPGCPIESLCLARARGTVALRPALRKRAAIPSFDLVTGIAIDRGRRVLLRRRALTGLLARMWEFPSTEMTAGEEPGDQARALLEDVLEGSAVERVTELAAVEHTFSHRKETYHPFRIDLATAGDARTPCSWIERKLLWSQPMPRAQRRIQKLVL